MRSTLSPAFTSSKIRVMVPFMVEVGDQMIASLKKQIEDAKGKAVLVGRQLNSGLIAYDEDERYGVFNFYLSLIDKGRFE